MYILIGGNPYRGYTNTLTYTSLTVVWTGTTLKEARRVIKRKWEDCGGLLLLINGRTGEEVKVA